MRIRTIFSGIHRILGLLLCALFLMWFVSGIVMIYHGFPRASQEYKIARQQPLGQLSISMDSLYHLAPDSVKLQSMSIEMRFDRPIIRFSGKGIPGPFYIDSIEPIEAFDENVRTQIIQLWCDAPVLRIDTLQQVDQWIPFGRLNEEMPVYKYHFADEAKHQLYMTSRDGRVLQFTDKESRFWAWLGAIPHWVYFTSLRQHQTLWIESVKWAAGIGCIMCLVGIGLALAVYFKKTASGQFHIPYKKRWIRWHFISGLAFGLFAITFAFSGMMSLMDIPDWLKKKPKGKVEQRTSPRFFRNAPMLPIDTYQLDYRKLLSDATIDSIKSITWSSWNEYPYYKVRTNQEKLNIDASDSTRIAPFHLTEEMICADIQRQLGDSAVWKIDLLTQEDEDYFGRKKERVPLPVYRVIVEDELHTRFYYHPETLMQRRIDDNSRTRSFLYGGLHSLHIKFLTDRPVLWNIVMYVLLLGGTFLSLTGVVLSVKWIIRKINKTLNKKKNE